MEDRHFVRPVSKNDKTTPNKRIHIAIIITKFEKPYFPSPKTKHSLTSLSHCNQPLWNSILKLIMIYILQKCFKMKKPFPNEIARSWNSDTQQVRKADTEGSVFAGLFLWSEKDGGISCTIFWTEARIDVRFKLQTLLPSEWRCDGRNSKGIGRFVFVVELQTVLVVKFWYLCKEVQKNKVASMKKLSTQRAYRTRNNRCQYQPSESIYSIILKTHWNEDKSVPFLISNFRRVLNVLCFFWVIPRLLNFIYRRFGTLCSIFIAR